MQTTTFHIGNEQIVRELEKRGVPINDGKIVVPKADIIRHFEPTNLCVFMWTMNGKTFDYRELQSFVDKPLRYCLNIDGVMIVDTQPFNG